MVEPTFGHRGRLGIVGECDGGAKTGKRERELSIILPAIAVTLPPGQLEPLELLETGQDVVNGSAFLRLEAK